MPGNKQTLLKAAQEWLDLFECDQITAEELAALIELRERDARREALEWAQDECFGDLPDTIDTEIARLRAEGESNAE